MSMILRMLCESINDLFYNVDCAGLQKEPAQPGSAQPSAIHPDSHQARQATSQQLRATQPAGHSAGHPAPTSQPCWCQNRAKAFEKSDSRHQAVPDRPFR